MPVILWNNVSAYFYYFRSKKVTCLLYMYTQVDIWYTFLKIFIKLEI